VAAPKSVGHGKVMPPNTRSREVVLTYAQHMAFKVGVRMRKHQLEARSYWIGLKTEFGWVGAKARLSLYSHDERKIFQLCREVIELHWRGEGVWQIQVTALDPRPMAMQLDLFASTSAEQQMQSRLHTAMDSINQRYGAFTLSPARLLNRSDMPNVIAPAWKPDGLRQTI
jgi:DNA polymerase-4